MNTMLRLRTARLLSASLLAPLLAFAVAASSYVAVRCALTGALSAAPCCPEPAAASDDAPEAAGATLDASCCDPVVVSTGKIPALNADRAQGDGLLAPAMRPVLFLAGVAVPPPLLSLRARARAARPPGLAPPPAYILRHALLL